MMRGVLVAVIPVATWLRHLGPTARKHRASHLGAPPEAEERIAPSVPPRGNPSQTELRYIACRLPHTKWGRRYARTPSGSSTASDPFEHPRRRSGLPGSLKTTS